MNYILCAFVLTGLLELESAHAGEVEDKFDADIRVAVEYTHNMEYQKALQVLDVLLEEAPDSPAGYFFKATVYYQMAEMDPDTLKRREARAHFERMFEMTVARAEAKLAKNEKDAKALFYLGTAYGLKAMVLGRKDHLWAAMGNVKTGLSYLRIAVTLDSTLYDAYAWLGVAEYRAKTARVPWAMEPLKFMATQLFVGGADREAGLRQMEVAARKGRYMRTLAKLWLCAAYMSEKRYEEVLNLAEELHAQHPMDRWAAGLLLRARRKIAEYEEEQQYGELKKRIHEGDELERRGKFEEALRTWREIVEEDATHLKGRMMLTLHQEGRVSMGDDFSRARIDTLRWRVRSYDPGVAMEEQNGHLRIHGTSTINRPVSSELLLRPTIPPYDFTVAVDLKSPPVSSFEAGLRISGHGSDLRIIARLDGYYVYVRRDRQRHSRRIYHIPSDGGSDFHTLKIEYNARREVAKLYIDDTKRTERSLPFVGAQVYLFGTTNVLGTVVDCAFDHFSVEVFKESPSDH